MWHLNMSSEWSIEKFYLNSTLNFGIPPVLIFQLEVYYQVDRLLTGLTAQQKGTTARWYSNKTSLVLISSSFPFFHWISCPFKSFHGVCGALTNIRSEDDISYIPIKISDLVIIHEIVFFLHSRKNWWFNLKVGKLFSFRHRGIVH